MRCGAAKGAFYKRKAIDQAAAVMKAGIYNEHIINE